MTVKFKSTRFLRLRQRNLRVFKQLRIIKAKDQTLIDTNHKWG